MIHYCTYFDSNYLTRGIALYLSLKRHSPPFVLWVLCFDDKAFDALVKVNEADLRPIRLSDFEGGDEPLLAAKPTRSRIEYYFTCTPSLPLYVLQQDPAIDSVTYLDADLRFYSDPTELLATGGSRSVTIIPHGFPEHLRQHEQYGTYNVGLVSFWSDDASRALLERWRSQCIEWCFDRVEDGKFADQRYLDAWPGYPGVTVIHHPGADLAPWNIVARRLELVGDGLMVNGEPVIFFHFAAFKYLGRGMFDLGLRPYGTISRRARQRLYGGYVDDLRQARRWLADRGVVARLGVAIRGHHALDLRHLIRDLWHGRTMLTLRASGF